MRSKLITEGDIGKVFGRYTILDVYKNKSRTYYKAVCSEGHERDVRVDALKRDCEKCFECDVANDLSYSREHCIWTGMLQRCYNENSPAYQLYGKIGIAVYSSWGFGREGFLSFYDYMGPCPEGMSLDRWPNKAGNYEPGNVRWATSSEQGFNQKLRNTNNTGRTGICWSEAKGKWRATITVNNKSIHLKYSDSFEEAVKYREEAEIKYFGENKE